MIPKKFYFTYKTEDLPTVYRENIARWQNHFPDWEICFYSDRKILQFFKCHFPEHLSDIENISQGIVLADLFRYGILYIYGGMYNDIDTIPFNFFPEDWLSYDAVIGYEYQPSKFECQIVPSYSKDTFCQWSFLSKPRHPLFKEALEKSLENVRKKRFKFSHEKEILEGTGPLLFTEVAIKYLKNPEILFLDMDVFSPIYLKKVDLSNCVVFHQFHGKSGWKLELQCPQIKWHSGIIP